MLANLQSALETYDASPSSTSAAQGVVTAAARSRPIAQHRRRSGAERARDRPIPTWRRRSTPSIRCSRQFTSVNATIVSGTATGADVSSAEDTRDSILTQLSQQIGISTVANPDGSTSIYTDSGVTLFQGGTPRTVSFTPTATYTDGATGNAVMVDGVPITGSSSPMAIQSGALGGPRQSARRRRAAIRRATRPDRRRPHQRLRRERSDGRNRADAARPVHLFRRDRRARDIRRRPASRPRSRSTPTSIRRRAATSISCATAASPTRPIPPTPTTRPARRATPAASSR